MPDIKIAIKVLHRLQEVSSGRWNWKPRNHIFILLLMGSLFISGCVSLPDPETSQIHDQEIITLLQGDGNSAGQSFVTRRASLNSLTIWLGSEQASAQGLLRVEFFNSPSDVNPIYTSTFSTSQINAKTALGIPLPSRDAPAGQAYYLRLSAVGKSLQLFGRSEDIYPQGAFFINDIPQPADLAFRTTYRYNWDALFEDVQTFVKYAWLVIPLGFLLLIPGWLLLDLLNGFNDFDIGARIALVVGASLAFCPVVMLWTTTLKLSWNSTALSISMVMMTTVLTIRHLQRVRTKLRSIPVTLSSDPNKRNVLHTIALVGIFLLTLATRLIMVRDYATPTWVDSVHHGMITRLILENGAFPASYMPYMNIQPTEYHPGFHSLLATLVWLSGLRLEQAMLLFGQVLNALAVFSTYLLTVALFSDRQAGLIAALLTGLFTPMPAYYASWGRYTHLAGMLVLPVFFAALKRLWNTPLTTLNLSDSKARLRKSWLYTAESLAILAIVSGGLFLIHYRIASFCALLALAFWISQTSTTWRERINRAGLAWLGALSTILLLSPWFVPTLTQTLLPKLVLPETRPPLFSSFTWQYLTAGYGRYTVLLAIFGLVLGISLRKKPALTILLWIILLFMLPNLSALGIPGGSFVNHTAVEISLYLPISILGGYIVSQTILGGVGLLPTRWQQYARWIFLPFAIAFAFMGARRTLTILNPITVLSRQPDLPALAWIETNIPENETIAINPFLWGYGIYAGSDGGYWITPLTGHVTMPPPVLYAVSAREEVNRINQICAQIIAQGKDASQLWETLRKNDIRYVYLGARGGVISPQALAGSPQFRLLYQKNGSWLFEALQFP